MTTLENVQFDMHTHGPWTYWKHVEGLFAGFRNYVMDKEYPLPRTMDTLLNLYLPHTEDGHVAIVLCNYDLDRYADITKPLALITGEKKRLKNEFVLKDIDTSNIKQLIGFKAHNGNNFYVVKGQEVLVSEGHLLTFPIENNITAKAGTEYKTAERVLREARKNPLTLTFATHPCMNLSFAEKTALRIVNEAAWKSLGLTSENVEYLASNGLLDGVEVYNSAAGKHNKEITETAERIAKKFNLLEIVCSDTEYTNNVFTSYIVMNADFTDPEKLSNSVRQGLKLENCHGYTGKLKGSTMKQLNHFASHFLINGDRSLA